MGAGAAMLAGQELLRKLKRVASILLSCDPEQLQVESAVFSALNSDAKYNLRDLAKAYYSQMGMIPAPLRNEIGDLSVTRVYDPEWGTTSSSTHIAMVEIDPDTLKVDIKKYVVAEDCGQMLNPMIVDGQVHGGVAQGIGAALFEEMIYDDQGQNLTASLVDYVVPSSTEIPRMDIVHLDLEKPKTLGGVRGMGEGGTIGAPAAVANAVSDALAPLGQQVTVLPVTPERIFRLVQAGRAGTSTSHA
jgi:carbon-monoxide dehydrogenase large subunit